MLAVTVLVVGLITDTVSLLKLATYTSPPVTVLAATPTGVVPTPMVADLPALSRVADDGRIRTARGSVARPVDV